MSAQRYEVRTPLRDHLARSIDANQRGADGVLLDGGHVHAVLDLERTYRQPRERLAARPALKGTAQVARQRANIRATAAMNVERQRRPLIRKHVDPIDAHALDPNGRRLAPVSQLVT